MSLPAGAYTLAATAGTEDGVRVLVDDQQALARAGSLRAAVLADKPNGYWRLGDPAGSTSAADSSGKGRTAAYTAAVLRRPGMIPRNPDTAVGFDAAAGSRVTLPGNPLTSATPTVELWFRGTGPGVLFGYQNTVLPAAATHYVPALYVGTDGYPHGGCWPATDTGPMQSATLVTDGGWHHAVVTRDSTGRQSLYLDGAGDDQITGGGLDWQDMTRAQLGSGRSEGWPAGQPGATAGFTGDIDEAAAYPHPAATAPAPCSARGSPLPGVTGPQPCATLKGSR